ncbi:MAG: protein phosphatase CheZ [Rhodocyclaceae bacterium]|nr:protein phosphatase CheZ [Rhodocyclaceae bacterium]
MSANDADSPELEALFDSIVAETVAARCAETGETPPASTSTSLPAHPGVSAASPGGAPGDVFAHVGQLTRQLHDTLRELGHDRKLAEVADSIPDTRDRLGYVARLTEDAANKVLAATERAQPLQDSIVAAAGALEARWSAVFASGSEPEAFRQLAEDTRAFLLSTRSAASATRDELRAIMMAQDFQDLTGQVIKRMTDLTTRLEQQLLAILIEHAPADRVADAGGLQGPAFNARTRGETLGNQGEVDALLESLGF